jgi:DNA polymerase III delta prime subunit
MQIENSLWAEKYRPLSLDDYVGNESFVEKIKYWISIDDIPHIILHSPQPGTGKTSAAKIIANALDADMIYINASDENSVDVVRDKIKTFAYTMGFKRWKIIILDEAARLSPQAQEALLNIMETFSKHTRFIFTCNAVEKLVAPLKSRSSIFGIIPPTKQLIAKRIVHILKSENVEFQKEDIAEIIHKYYPDQRSIINTCQSNTMNGKMILDKAQLTESGYLDKILECLTSVKDPKQTFQDIRQIIADSRVRTFDDLYHYLYENLDKFAPDGKKATTILHIAESSYRSTFVIDKEIEVMALFVNLIRDLA